MRSLIIFHVSLHHAALKMLSGESRNMTKQKVKISVVEAAIQHLLNAGRCYGLALSARYLHFILFINLFKPIKYDD